MPEFEQLTDVQKIEIETLLNRLNVDCRSNSIESLREMVNTYVSYNMNNVAAIKCKVKNYAKTNAPAVTVTSPPDSKEDKQKQILQSIHNLIIRNPITTMLMSLNINPCV